LEEEFMLAGRNLLLILVLLFPVTASAQDSSEELLAAARKGDVAAVKALLDKGVDVNGKSRYGATALSYACDRGNLEMVTLLIERGADINVKDTFYGATPISWASNNGHTEVVKLLLEKGAKGIDSVLMDAVDSKNPAMIKVVLDKGGLSPATLTTALSAATRQKQTDIIDMLKKAGAQPAPPANYQVDPDTLKSYAGVYKSAGFELTFAIKDGKLVGGAAGQDPFTLAARDKTTFIIVEFDGVTIKFQAEGEKVTGLTVTRGDQTTVFQKAEQK
jgi:hypothetical protein